MKPERLARRALWLANVALVAALFAFAFGVLLASPDPSPVDSVAPPATSVAPPPPKPLDHVPLKSPNPLGPVGGTPGPFESHVRFLDRFGIDGREPAFLFVVARGVFVNAYRGEPVRTFGGEIVPELAGWTLQEFIDGGARFVNGSRVVELRRS